MAKNKDGFEPGQVVSVADVLRTEKARAEKAVKKPKEKADE